MAENVNRLGVVGAGTMGAGIALLGLRAGLPVILCDIAPAMLEKARHYLQQHLERKGQGERLQHLQTTDSLAALATCDAIIEAAPERLDLKKELFGELDAVCPPPALLASNTSTFSITELAAATTRPERVGGMHFFNPAPVLPLVEIVAGARTAAATTARLIALAQRLGKTPVATQDTPGFIVNRVARPFYGEALRLVTEQTATPEQVDRIVTGAGFRMGPFRLMDLIGIDVNFTAMRSMYEQTFGDPRYKPSWLQLQKIKEGALGRKSGRGFFDYSEQQEDAASSPPKTTARLDGGVHIGAGTWAPGLSETCRQAGYTLQPAPDSTTRIALLPAGAGEQRDELLAALEKKLPDDAVILCQTADITIHEFATKAQKPERLAGFDGLFFGPSPVVTLVASPAMSERQRQTIADFVRSLGKSPEWIAGSPGLVLPRIVCMLANEGWFAVGEGVADAGVIDLAMRLGVNYPNGPLQWGSMLGLHRVLAVLEHLQREYGEERYRPAPYLRRQVYADAIAK